MRRLWVLMLGVRHLLPRPKQPDKAAEPKKFDPKQLMGVLGSSDPRRIKASGVVEFEPKKG